MKKPLEHRLAILFSIFAIWVGSAAGIWILHLTTNWYFFASNDMMFLGEVGTYYLARLGAQLPALALVVFIIHASDFRNPTRTAMFVAFAYHAVMTAVRLWRWPWSVLPGINPAIPIFAELTQLVLLVISVGLISRLLMWLGKLQLDRFSSR